MYLSVKSWKCLKYNDRSWRHYVYIYTYIYIYTTPDRAGVVFSMEQILVQVASAFSVSCIFYVSKRSS